MGKKKETANDRVRILRKSLKLNQEQFAKKLGLSSSAWSRVEIGETSLSDQNVLLICTPGRFVEDLTINEDWLRTGRGDMLLSPVIAEGQPKIYDDKGRALPPDEAELIKVYRELFISNKKMLSAEAKKILSIQETSKEGLILPSDTNAKD